MITIRTERKEDYVAIHELNQTAFGTEEESLLVQRIRQSVNYIPELSLVAVKDEKIVGHILFSPIIIKTEKDEIPALALAPMAVRP